MADPKFVRLADHLSRGMRADINSGFSIAGLDVVPMPDKEDNPEAYAYVKREISAGRLESASQAEYDEVHPDVYAALGVEVKREAVVQVAPPQETAIQAEALKAGRAIRASRQAQSDEDGFDADQERREALLEQQQAADDEDAPRARKAARKASRASRATPEQPSGADTDDNTDATGDGEDDNQ